MEEIYPDESLSQAMRAAYLKVQAVEAAMQRAQSTWRLLYLSFLCKSKVDLAYYDVIDVGQGIVKFVPKEKA